MGGILAIQKEVTDEEKVVNPISIIENEEDIKLEVPESKQLIIQEIIKKWFGRTNMDSSNFV